MATVQQHAELLAARNLSLDIITAVHLPGVVAEIAHLAASVTDLQLILDHGGSPPVLNATAMVLWESALTTLGQIPSLAIKLGGLYQYYKPTQVWGVFVCLR